MTGEQIGILIGVIAGGGWAFAGAAALWAAAAVTIGSVSR